MSFAVARYKTTSVDTASPVRLVVQLYDGAIRFMRAGARAIESGNANERGAALHRAHAIVGELASTLDASKAPELCEELDRLYDFVLHQITRAHMEEDSALLEPAITIMSDLRSAWNDLATKLG